MSKKSKTAGQNYYYFIFVVIFVCSLWCRVGFATATKKQSHKLPQPAYCAKPILLEGENFTGQKGGWSIDGSSSIGAIRNSKAGQGQYIRWENLKIQAGRYDLWASLARPASKEKDDYLLYAGPDIYNMRLVAKSSVAWDGAGHMWFKMADSVSLFATDTVLRWETSAATKVSFDCIQLASIDVPRDSFGKIWVRNHPFALMGLLGGGEDCNIDTYKASNMNMTLLWKNDFDLLKQSDREAIPWVYHIEVRKELGYTKLCDALKNHVKKVYDINPAGAWSWTIWDEVGGQRFPLAAEIVDWAKQAYPNILVYSNARPPGDDTASDWAGTDFPANWGYRDYINDYARIIKSDILSYDVYPFRDGGGTGNLYYSLKLVSDAGKMAGLPYWIFVQSSAWDQRWRVPSESDLRMQVFLSLTYGFTGIQYFVYDSGNAMVDEDGNPLPVYKTVQDLNREVANLGNTLRFLTNIDIRYIAGKEGEQINKTPNGVTHWASGAGRDFYIKNVGLDLSKPANKGAKKNGSIGFFTDDNNRRYFMLTNVYNGGDLTADQAKLDFIVEFSDKVDSLTNFNRLTGKEEIIKLKDHKLYITLPGGTGNLYHY